MLQDTSTDSSGTTCLLAILVVGRRFKTLLETYIVWQLNIAYVVLAIKENKTILARKVPALLRKQGRCYLQKQQLCKGASPLQQH